MLEVIFLKNSLKIPKTEGYEELPGWYQGKGIELSKVIQIIQNNFSSQTLEGRFRKIGRKTGLLLKLINPGARRSKVKVFQKKKVCSTRIFFISFFAYNPLVTAMYVFQGWMLPFWNHVADRWTSIRNQSTCFVVLAWSTMSMSGIDSWRLKRKIKESVSILDIFTIVMWNDSYLHTPGIIYTKTFKLGQWRQDNKPGSNGLPWCLRW